MEETEWSQLVKQTLSGDQAAYGEMYDRTIQGIYKTVHFLLDTKSDTDDVVQEVYIEAYKSLSKYDVSKPFKPWLTGIAIKQIHSYRRKRWMQLRIVKKAEQYVQSTMYDETNDLVDRLNNKQIVEIVNQLPFKLKQVVILHYLNEFSQEEIAKILEIPLGTVKSRIHAALKKLREKGQSNLILFEKVRKA